MNSEHLLQILWVVLSTLKFCNNEINALQKLCEQLEERMFEGGSTLVRTNLSKISGNSEDLDNSNTDGIFLLFTESG